MRISSWVMAADPPAPSPRRRLSAAPSEDATTPRISVDGQAHEVEDEGREEAQGDGQHDERRERQGLHAVDVGEALAQALQEVGLSRRR